jgi:hypothetical protein
VFIKPAGKGPMPLAVAECLRHLATRCSRMSRDCTDQVISKEIVIISVELVEKAETLEAYYSIAGPASNPDDIFSVEIFTTDDDEKA